MDNRIIVILLASVALVFGISYISGDADATEAMTFEYGGCTYEVDEASISTDAPFAYLIGYDNTTADVKIPSTYTISVVIEDNPAIDKECGIVIDASKFNFKGNTVIKTLTFEDGAEHVKLKDKSRRPVGIFNGCTNLETVVFGTSTPEVITQKCFMDCSKIDSVTFSEGLVEISLSAFQNCSSITSLTFKDGLKTIGMYAFYDCTSLVEINFNEDLNEIENQAFRHANLGGELSLPDSVTNIGQLCFEADLERPDRNVITSVNLGNGITKVCEGAFWGCNITEIIIPDSLANLYRAGLGRYSGSSPYGIHYTFGSSLEKFIVNETHPTYSTTDGVLFNKEKTVLLAYPSNKTGDYTVPENVTALGAGCFSRCGGLKNVNLPEHITEISFGAFSYSSVTHVNLENIQTYKSAAFESCESLGSVILCPELKNLVWMWEFKNCKNLEIDALPEGLEKIGECSFMGCSKLNISKLPDALTEIGRYAFSETGIQKLTVGAMTWDEGDTPITVNQYAFWNCDELTELNIGNIKTQRPDIANGINLESINYAPQFNLWKQTGSIQTSLDGKVWYKCLQGCKEETITIPADIRLNSRVFQDCLNLKHVIFEDRTEPLNLYYIFWNCTNLESIVFPNMANIGDCLIYGCDNLKYMSFPDSGEYSSESLDQPGRTFAGIDTPLKPKISDIQGYVWAGNGDGTFYRIGQTVNSTASSDWTSYVPADVTVYSDIKFSGNVQLEGTMTLSEGVTASGKLCNGVNELTFDKYTPVTGDSVISCDKTLTLTDAAATEGSVTDISRVTNMDINCFYDDGKGIIIDVDAFTNVPDGKVLIQYSVYDVIDDEVFLNPFKVSTVDVKGSSTLYASVGEKMLSCAVSYCYDFNGKTLCTPVSESAFAMPADFIQIEAPDTVELTFGDTVVKNGDYISYGTYDVKIAASDDLKYELNGVEISTIESISYFGQVLQIVPAPSS